MTTLPSLPSSSFLFLRQRASALALVSLVGCSGAGEDGDPMDGDTNSGTGSTSGGDVPGATGGSSTGGSGDVSGETGGAPGTGGVPGGGATGGTSATGGSDPNGTGGSDPTEPSSGCGTTAAHSSGGVNVDLVVSESGENREFYLSLPENYDPNTPHALIFGYPGTSWTGQQIQPYLEMESASVTPRDDEIFVYLTPLWRFDNGSTGGFALGPHGGNFAGNQDIQFTEAVAAFMKDNYCIDEDRLFATGHSWGGDMANVASCFTDLFRASVPIASNGPFWFHDGSTPISCDTDTVVWNMYGLADDWFNDGGENGREVRDFWLADRGCDGVGSATDLGITGEECEEYTGCRVPVRSCLYDASFGHQKPDYFAEEAMAFFRSFQ